MCKLQNRTPAGRTQIHEYQRAVRTEKKWKEMETMQRAYSSIGTAWSTLCGPAYVFQITPNEDNFGKELEFKCFARRQQQISAKPSFF